MIQVRLKSSLIRKTKQNLHSRIKQRRAGTVKLHLSSVPLRPQKLNSKYVNEHGIRKAMHNFVNEYGYTIS